LSFNVGCSVEDASMRSTCC